MLLQIYFVLMFLIFFFALVFKYRSQLRNVDLNVLNYLILRKEHEANSEIKNNIKLFDKDDSLPKVIHQTYFNLTKIPQKVFTNIRYFAPDFEHKVYDDIAVEHFLQSHFSPCVLKTFRRLHQGAHKADLFRYAVLYVYGGIYLDIKTELVRGITDIFRNGLTTVYSKKHNEIYQGVISSYPKNKMFLYLIDAIVRGPSNPLYNRHCLDMYAYLLSNKNKDIKITMYQEKCSSIDCSNCADGFDRYGYCCNIYDGKNIIIKTRYSDYPWK